MTAPGGGEGSVGVTGGYPVELPLAGRRVVVVGGGDVAQRQVFALLAAGADDVLVVAPVLTPVLQDLAVQGLVRAVRRRFVKSDLDGAWLVVPCVPPDVVAAVTAAADRRRIWWLERSNSCPLRTLVLGGARSGKSALAEERLAGAGQVDYAAPGPAPDAGDNPEWAARVRAHQARRPAGWRTWETLDLEPLLTAGTAVPLLVDCLSTWLAGVMDACGVWAERPGADDALAARTGDLVAAWRAATRPVVAVSNEVGSGVVPATASGRRYRDELGRLNARVAAECERVLLVTAGLAQRLK
ncbi:MAG: bifunctional adenosylcobinamide kinase/adenosylcobinamide-phosphate guanylyltransferase [Mycobacteriales bacterium]